MATTVCQKFYTVGIQIPDLPGIQMVNKQIEECSGIWMPFEKWTLLSCIQMVNDRPIQLTPLV